LVSEGRISAVAPRAELVIPPDAHRHDVTGHWVLTCTAISPATTSTCRWNCFW
jgi:hypothetical protein